MKNLFRIALIKSATICHSELGKLLCQVLSATKAKSEKSANRLINTADFFTSDQQLALHLHRSKSCVKKYRLKGYIPFVSESGHILVKKSDVDKAVELYPLLMAVSPLPSRPAPRIFTRIVESDTKNAVIHFTYQGRECFILTNRKKAPVRSVVYSLCREFIGMIHQFKPFKIAPDNIRVAA